MTSTRRWGCVVPRTLSFAEAICSEGVDRLLGLASEGRGCERVEVRVEGFRGWSAELERGGGFHVIDFSAVRMMQMGVGEMVQWLIAASLTKHV
jgi:hypothetical protein